MIDKVDSMSVSSTTRQRAGKKWLLAAGDFVVFLIFAAAGRASHDVASPGVPLLGTLSTAAPFALAWFGVAPFLGALTPARLLQPRPAMVRTVATWLVAGPLGLILRSVWLQRPIPPTFAAIVMAGHLILLLFWRLGYVWFLNRERT